MAYTASWEREGFTVEHGRDKNEPVPFRGARTGNVTLQSGAPGVLRAAEVTQMGCQGTATRLDHHFGNNHNKIKIRIRAAA